MGFPNILTRVCIREPKQGPIRSTHANISNLRDKSQISIFFDSKVIVEGLSRDEAFVSLPRLADTSAVEISNILGLPHRNLYMEITRSVASRMTYALLLKMEIEIYSFLELHPFVPQPFLTPIGDVEEEEIFKGQFKTFLEKRYIGGAVYTSTGYETRFLNLELLSLFASHNSIPYSELFDSLIELYQASFLGAVEVEWGNQRIYSNYFIPIRIPSGDTNFSGPRTGEVWQIINSEMRR